jgi:hypothetical protein
MISLGGETYDENLFRAGQLRADLCQIATEYSFQHGSRIVDAILAKYEVSRKKW